jgi:hypothetical protein
MAIIILPLLTAARIKAALKTSASLYGTTLEAITISRRARKIPAVAARNAAIQGLREMGYSYALLADKFDYRVASIAHLVGSRMPEDTDEELFAAIKEAVTTGRAVVLRGETSAKPPRHGKYIFSPPTNKGPIPMPSPDRRVTAGDLMQQRADQEQRVKRIRQLEDDYLSGRYPNASSRGL